jgi:microcystin-dependent protein
MSDAYLGEIRMFGGNFAPKGWALCNGQLLAISQNTALFSILGTMYGGDGRTTFALPNLQGYAPMSFGQGPGLTDRVQGETGGSGTVELTSATIPAHSHLFQGEQVIATSTEPAGNDVASNRTVFSYTTPGASGLQTAPMAVAAIGLAGGNQPHNNMQPYLAVSFIICTAGIFPPRN